VGGRIVLMKDDVFSFENRVFSQEFFRLVWLKDWNTRTVGFLKYMAAFFHPHLGLF
jgi:hypothetical protein